MSGGGQAAWTGHRESPILVLYLILLCCVTLGQWHPRSGPWSPQNARTCRLSQPTAHHPRSVRGPSANQSLFTGRWMSDKRILVPSALPLRPAGSWAESPWPDGMCAQEFRSDFNIPSNLIGSTNPKEKKTKPYASDRVTFSFLLLKSLGLRPIPGPGENLEIALELLRQTRGWGPQGWRPGKNRDSLAGRGVSID